MIVLRSLHWCSALILTCTFLLEIYALFFVLNLFCLQPSSRFDELPDDFDPSGRLGSFDDGDPQTTNLYVGNLSPKVIFLFLVEFMCYFLIFVLNLYLTIRSLCSHRLMKISFCALLEDLGP